MNYTELNKLLSQGMSMEQAMQEVAKLEGSPKKKGFYSGLKDGLNEVDDKSIVDDFTTSAQDMLDKTDFVNMFNKYESGELQLPEADSEDIASTSNVPGTMKKKKLVPARKRTSSDTDTQILMDTEDSTEYHGATEAVEPPKPTAVAAPRTPLAPKKKTVPLPVPSTQRSTLRRFGRPELIALLRSTPDPLDPNINEGIASALDSKPMLSDGGRSIEIRDDEITPALSLMSQDKNEEAKAFMVNLYNEKYGKPIEPIAPPTVPVPPTESPLQQYNKIAKPIMNEIDQKEYDAQLAQQSWNVNRELSKAAKNNVVDLPPGKIPPYAGAVKPEFYNNYMNQAMEEIPMPTMIPEPPTDSVSGRHSRILSELLQQGKEINVPDPSLAPPYDNGEPNPDQIGVWPPVPETKDKPWSKFNKMLSNSGPTLWRSAMETGSNMGRVYAGKDIKPHTAYPDAIAKEEAIKFEMDKLKKPGTGSRQENQLRREFSTRVKQAEAGISNFKKLNDAVKAFVSGKSDSDNIDSTAALYLGKLYIQTQEPGLAVLMNEQLLASQGDPQKQNQIINFFLNKVGIAPQNMSVEQAKRLVNVSIPKAEVFKNELSRYITEYDKIATSQGYDPDLITTPDFYSPYLDPTLTTRFNIGGTAGQPAPAQNPSGTLVEDPPGSGNWIIVP